jgi:hypothetical protein
LPNLNGTDRGQHREAAEPAYRALAEIFLLGRIIHWDRIEVLPISASMLATRWRFQTNGLNCLKSISDKILTYHHDVWRAQETRRSKQERAVKSE